MAEYQKERVSTKTRTKLILGFLSLSACIVLISSLSLYGHRADGSGNDRQEVSNNAGAASENFQNNEDQFNLSEAFSTDALILFFSILSVTIGLIVSLSIYHDLENIAALKQKLNQESLIRRNKEKELENILNSMSEGFALHEILMDDQGRPSNYRFKYLNPAFESLLGIKAEDLIGRTVLDVFPQTEAYWIETYGNVALTGRPVIFENYSKALGRYYRVSAYSPEHGQFAVSFSDITERVAGKKELEKKNQTLWVTLKSIGDGVISTDDRGRITFINPMAERLTGWMNDEAAGKPLEDVFHIVNQHTGVLCENPARKVLESGKITELANHTCLISRTGERFVIEDSAAPICEPEGTLQGVIIVFRDSTEKSRLRDAANRAQRLESLGGLAGGIAHDFNNYLMGISGYIELVRNQMLLRQSEKEAARLEKILNITERAKSLTQQLLTFARGDNMKCVVTDLRDVINHTVNLLVCETSVKVEISIDDDLGLCLCDKSRIVQCLENLILNALEAMPEEGTLSINAGNVKDGASYGVNTCGIELTVADTGTGIPPSIRDRIFDPFFSTKEEGRGLGLATVHSIVKNHEGVLKVQSEEGRGSAFKIFLPAAGASPSDASEAREKSQETGGDTILVLDDQEYINEILKEILESEGYRVITVTTSVEALEIFREDRQSQKQIGACILDQTLPGDLRGHEVAQKMKSLDSDVVLIATSGYAQSDVIKNPQQYSFEDSIKKPFDSRRLKAMLSRYLVKPDEETYI